MGSLALLALPPNTKTRKKETGFWVFWLRLEFGIWDSGLSAWGFGLGLGFRVYGLEFRVSGSRFRAGFSLGFWV